MFSLDDLKKIYEIKHIIRNNHEENVHHLKLFLDFDGVINAGIDLKHFEYKELPCGFVNLSNPNCVHLLNQLVKDYNLSIVLSTSWRTTGIPMCYQYLIEIGMDEDIHIEGMTSLESLGSRENQIIQYLLEKPNFSGFLILDDIRMEHLEKYQVLTDFDEGYNEERDQRAREILSSF